MYTTQPLISFLGWWLCRSRKNLHTPFLTFLSARKFLTLPEAYKKIIIQHSKDKIEKILSLSFSSCDLTVILILTDIYNSRCIVVLHKTCIAFSLPSFPSLIFYLNWNSWWNIEFVVVALVVAITMLVVFISYITTNRVDTCIHEFNVFSFWFSSGGSQVSVCRYVICNVFTYIYTVFLLT